MRARMWQIDAFTDRPFAGNPAAVVEPLDAWPADDTLMAIAGENNLSETAFLVPEPDHAAADFHLRWFTPAVEVELCGHATLATAHTLRTHLGFAGDRVRFRTLSGVVSVGLAGERLALDFPLKQPRRIDPPADLVAALGAEPVEVVRDSGPRELADTIAAVYDSEAAIRALEPDFRALARVEQGYITVTAPGDGSDFASRFFAPAKGIDEDPVTGSVHCLLTPYWAERLGKRELLARQVSRRGGRLWCAVEGDRVRIEGHAVTYLEGTIHLPD